MYYVLNNSPSNQPFFFYFVRPNNMAINIQQNYSILRTSVRDPQSPSPLLINFFALSNMNYAERVALQNNIDVNETTIDNLQSQELYKKSI